MKINKKFNIKETVYIKTDPDQNEGIVAEIRVTPVGLIYAVSFGMQKADFYDFELSNQKRY